MVMGVVACFRLMLRWIVCAKNEICGKEKTWEMNWWGRTHSQPKRRRRWTKWRATRAMRCNGNIYKGKNSYRSEYDAYWIRWQRVSSIFHIRRIFCLLFLFLVASGANVLWASINVHEIQYLHHFIRVSKWNLILLRLSTLHRYQMRLISRSRAFLVVFSIEIFTLSEFNSHSWPISLLRRVCLEFVWIQWQNEASYK